MEQFKNIWTITDRVAADYKTGALLSTLVQTYTGEGYRENNGGYVHTSTLSKIAVSKGCEPRNNTCKNDTKKSKPKKEKKAFSHTLPDSPIKKEKVVLNLNDQSVRTELQEVGLFIADVLSLNGYDMDDARTAALVAHSLEVYAHSVKHVAVKNRAVYIGSIKNG